MDEDFRLGNSEGYEALVAAMGLEPLGSWWLPGVRRSGTARRLLAAAEAEGAPGLDPAEAAALVLAGGDEFLLTFEGPHAPRSCKGRAWRRVRLPAADPVAALVRLLSAADPDPRGLIVATTDGESIARVVDSPRGPRLLALTGIGARIADRAEVAALEGAREGEAVWEAFLAGPEPERPVLGGWYEGLSANPSVPEDVRRDVLRAFPLPSRTLPPDAFMEEVLALPDPEDRLRAVHMHGELGPAHWARLVRAADTPRERWRLAMVAADGRIPWDEESCVLLATDPSGRVRAEAVGLTGLPVRHLLALTRDADAAVRAAACRTAWPVLSAERRRALLADGAASVRTEALLRHHEEEPLTPERFGRDVPADRAVGSCLLAPDLVEHLLATGDTRLRVEIAGNPRLDPHTVARLAEDADDRVRHTVALRADLTEEQRAAVRVDIDPSDMSPTLPWVAERHEDPEAMRVLAGSSHPLVRRSVARARRLPPDVVRCLSRDPDRVVQLFLAESCEDAPAEMLLRVWTWWTGSMSSPGRPRTHPNFPREGMLRYADDPHGRMRRLALDDPHSGPELVARFARDRDPEVRRRAAEDPRLSVTDAARLAEDPDDSVRAIVLREGRLPARVLAQRLLDPDMIRDAALNPWIPPHVIRAMAGRCAVLLEGRKGA
ncbi:PE-PGRS family protein [Streptomyces sp. NPDC087917]|uniref:PE-PGRS family protein n=1 Tax=Streptomyces sp. NPDC087917 TaxID=3155060 RepID=UPI003428D4B2